MTKENKGNEAKIDKALETLTQLLRYEIDNNGSNYDTQLNAWKLIEAIYKYEEYE